MEDGRDRVARTGISHANFGTFSGNLAPQARHELVPSQETIASRNVVWELAADVVCGQGLGKKVPISKLQRNTNRQFPTGMGSGTFNRELAQPRDELGRSPPPTGIHLREGRYGGLDDGAGRRVWIALSDGDGWRDATRTHSRDGYATAMDRAFYRGSHKDEPGNAHAVPSTAMSKNRAGTMRMHRFGVKSLATMMVWLGLLSSRIARMMHYSLAPFLIETGRQANYF
jgi:hypothetical protein